MKDEALKYRKVGWQVIPLYDQTKVPTINWKEYQSRMATDKEFNQWFSDPKVTGLGVITGKLSGIVVVDEDSYKADGMKFEFESPLVVRTARGGHHHYFKYTEPIKTSGFRQGINIEIKSDGGFIVLPPSVVITYPSIGETGTYVWEKQCKLSRLPTITEAELLPYRGSLSRNGALQLQDFLKGSAGTRHNDLRTVALMILNRFQQVEWDLAELAIRSAASQQDPPLTEREADRIISDTENFVRNNPKEAKKEVEAITNKREWQPATVDEIADVRNADIKLESMSPLTGWPELDKLIKGFVPGHVYTLTGDTNVGKTSLACNFAVNLQQQGKKTLYIALEPDVVLVDYLASCRLQKPFPELTPADRKDPGGLIKIFLGKDITSADDLVEAVETMEERFDLVVIDHIGYFVHSEKDWIQQQANIIKQLARLAKEKKCAVMIIAHLRKPASARQPKPELAKTELDKYGWLPTQNDISGAAAFKQDSTEVMIAIRKYKPTDEFSITFDDEGQLLVTKTKTGPNGAVPLIFSERTAIIMSRAQALLIPEKKKQMEDKAREEQQLRLGGEENAPF